MIICIFADYFNHKIIPTNFFLQFYTKISNFHVSNYHSVFPMYFNDFFVLISINLPYHWLSHQRFRKVDCMHSQSWRIEIVKISRLETKKFSFLPQHQMCKYTLKNFNYFSFGGVDVGPCTFFLLFPSFSLPFLFDMDEIFIFWVLLLHIGGTDTRCCCLQSFSIVSWTQKYSTNVRHWLGMVSGSNKWFSTFNNESEQKKIRNQ